MAPGGLSCINSFDYIYLWLIIIYIKINIYSMQFSMFKFYSIHTRPDQANTNSIRLTVKLNSYSFCFCFYSYHYYIAYWSAVILYTSNSYRFIFHLSIYWLLDFNNTTPYNVFPYVYTFTNTVNISVRLLVQIHCCKC